MANPTPAATAAPPVRLGLGFAAGFLSTLSFHQITVAVLWAAGIVPFAPYGLEPTAPLGVPSVLSLAFWGGVWGLPYAFVDTRFPRGIAYWIGAFAFGAILPTLLALLVVARLKGGLPAGEARIALWLVGFAVNGAWGVGTGAFLRLFERNVRGYPAPDS